MQCEAAERYIGKQLVKLIVVGVYGDAIVGGGIVKFLEEKVMRSLRIIERAGKIRFPAVGEPL